MKPAAPRARTPARQVRASHGRQDRFLNVPGGTNSYAEHPMADPFSDWYSPFMNPLLLIIILLLLFGGGGFYLGGPAYGGGGLGLILLICLIVYLLGGFRARE